MDTPTPVKLRQRKRKQDLIVKEKNVAPAKTPRPYVRKKNLEQVNPENVSDSSSASKSARKVGRKRKVMRISDFSLTPAAIDVDTVSPITVSDDTVNPLVRVNSVDNIEQTDCSEFPAINSDLNSSNQSLLLSNRPLPLMPPPTFICMATNEVTTTNSNTLDGVELEQRSSIGLNSTFSINTPTDNTTLTTNTSKSNSFNDSNMVIKKEAEVQCEFVNLSSQPKAIKLEPAGSNNNEYQSDHQEFYTDLLKFCLNSNLSFVKLTGSESRLFFYKNFGVSVPLPDKMKNHVLQPLQQIKMDKLKETVANHNIYLIMKIHDNDERGHILTIMVGILNGKPAQTYLYKLSIIQEVDLTILSRELFNALHNLYQGLVFEKLFLLITDDSPLMGQIAIFLKTLHPKVRHITCLYQVCDDICEQFRKNHPHMKLYVNTINGFLFSSPKILIKYKKSTNGQRELPVPPSKLHGFNWMLVAGDFFDEHRKITAAIEESLEGQTKENYLVKVNNLLEDKELQHEWIDYKGYLGIEAIINSMKCGSKNLMEMKKMILGLGRYPKRSAIIQRIKELIQSNQSLSEMLTIAEQIDTDNDIDPNLKVFNYAPLSTLASFDCYQTLKTINKENGGSIDNDLLESLTFLSHNKDL